MPLYIMHIDTHASFVLVRLARSLDWSFQIGALFSFVGRAAVLCMKTTVITAATPVRVPFAFLSFSSCSLINVFKSPEKWLEKFPDWCKACGHSINRFFFSFFSHSASVPWKLSLQRMRQCLPTDLWYSLRYPLPVGLLWGMPVWFWIHAEWKWLCQSWEMWLLPPWALLWGE